jgi:nucleotide-binding universal stress UspA family protein
MKHSILVAVDDSPEAERALRYVAGFADGEITVRLLHLLPPIPSVHLEHGGSENPAEQERLDAELTEQREAWLREEEIKAQPVLERARALLRELGVPGNAVAAECRPSVDGVAVARDCVEAARDGGCDTIAVGRSEQHGIKRIFHPHACSDLVRKASGLTVWVVE